MSQTHRFGRRISLPSTAQIKYELRVFSAHEDVRKRRTAEGALDIAPTAPNITGLESIQSEQELK